MCGTCRKAPRVVRKPSSTGAPTTPKPASSGSSDQRSKITGITYVPKN